MITRYLILLVLISLIGCTSKERQTYKYLKSIPLRKAIYQTTYLDNDSTSIDTIHVGIEHGKVLHYFHEPDSIKELELFFLTEYPTISDSEFWNVDLTYEVASDSIIYLDTAIWELGTIKSYKIKGKSYDILRQPKWIFTKSRHPNLFSFYTSEFGLISSLSKKQKRELISLGNANNDPIKNLLSTLQADSTFFNLKHEYQSMGDL